MSLVTSCRSSLPFPSLSYILKDHLSRSSRFPRRTRCSAATYSRKSSRLSYRSPEGGSQGFCRGRTEQAHLVGVEGAEDGLHVEGLLHRAAGDAEDPPELVEVQSAARTLLHEEDAQLLDLSRVQLLGAALVLSHSPGGPAGRSSPLSPQRSVPPQPQSEAKWRPDPSD